MKAFQSDISSDQYFRFVYVKAKCQIAIILIGVRGFQSDISSDQFAGICLCNKIYNYKVHYPFVKILLKLLLMDLHFYAKLLYIFFSNWPIAKSNNWFKQYQLSTSSLHFFQ